jgi:hypothetical protein
LKSSIRGAHKWNRKTIPRDDELSLLAMIFEKERGH